MQYTIKDSFLRRVLKLSYWTTDGNKNDIFSQDINEIQVHFGQFTSALNNLKSSAKYFPDEFFNIWDEAITELNKKYPRPESRDYQSYRKIATQDFKNLQEVVQNITLDLNDENTCVRLLYSFHSLINYKKLDFEEFNNVFGEKEGREIAYKALNCYMKDKNIKYNSGFCVLCPKDEATGKFLRIWTEEFLKRKEKAPLKDILDFLFNRVMFCHSISTVNGMKLASKFLFDYIAANGASNDEFVEAFNVCKENISKYNKFKALDTLEALAKKHKVYFNKDDAVENNNVNIFNVVVANREYYFNKVVFNNLFKLKEKEQIEFERKISSNLKKGFNVFFKNFASFNNFSASLIGSSQSGSFGLGISYLINNPDNSQEALALFDIIMKKVMDAIVFSNYEQICNWDEQTIFQIYEEYNSEVLKAQLDKNMEDVYPSVNEDENLDVQESAYKI